LNDGLPSLDIVFLNAFAKSINPIAALKKINQVAVLSTHVKKNISTRGRNYLQALLYAALLTGNAI
jgi:hypothetical protein